MSTILDELFASAESDYKAANNVPPSITASVTTNTTGGYKTTTNSVASYPTITLNYTPSGEEKGTGGVPVVHFYPAQFSGSSGSHSLTIKAPNPSADFNYTAGWQGSNFVVANVDPTTNIVNFAIGSLFLTVSLCGYLPGASNQ